MSILSIVSLFLPTVNNVIGWLLNRFAKNGVSTIQGTVAGAAVIGLLEGMGCNLSMAKEALLGVIAALPGVLATDAKVTGTTLAEAIKEAARPQTPDGSVTHT